MRINNASEEQPKILKDFIKNLFEKLFKSKIYRNSLPRGTCLANDLVRLNEGVIQEIWDVGAHHGETSLSFARDYPEAKIQSFEPISQNYDLLIQNCSHLKNFRTHKLALGDTNTRTEVFMQNNSVIHSLRDDLNKASSNDSVSEIVEVKTIDYLVKRFLLQNIDLLKIDVEGYEMQVLKGARESLEEKKISFIYLETGLDNRFVPIQSLVEYLEPYGYFPFAFYEQTAHWTGIQNLWYWNTLFVKEDLL